MRSSRPDSNAGTASYRPRSTRPSLATVRKAADQAATRICVAVMQIAVRPAILPRTGRSGLAPHVKALVAVDTGAYDIPYLVKISGGRLPILYAALNTPSKWRNWSPISYAGGASGMPVLVAWSGARFRVDVSTHFADALAAHGHPVTRFAEPPATTTLPSAAR